MDEDFLYEKETYQIIGAMMEVHKTLGCGFLEAVYQEALSIEFEKQNIPFVKEKKLILFYKGIQIEKFYIADFVCFDKIIVELKALSALTSTHDSIMINYLKATKLKVGLLANFGERSLKHKRLIY
ncbi:MAG: GxxExxY protein [Paludibacter sp.]|nr:GxxExxY protein [Paludibacter sp.]